MNTRRHVLGLLGLNTLALQATWAQQSGKVWRIGVLNLSTQKFYIDAGWQKLLLQGLREHGYVEGKNFVLEERFADDDATRLPTLAADLLRAGVDVIVTASTPVTLAAQKSTSTTPIVVLLDADPVANGFAHSLARPGKNLTGLSTQFGETTVKIIELLRQLNPKLTRLGILTTPGNSVMHQRMLGTIVPSAQKSGLQITAHAIAQATDFESVFARLQHERAQAVMALPDGFFASHMKQMAELASKHRLLSAYGRDQFPQAGGLISYGQKNATDNWRLGAKFIDRIFKGAKPGDIPFEQPTQFELVLNLKTAKALGIKVPQSIMLQATRVIE